MALQDQSFEKTVRKTYRKKLPVLDVSDFLAGKEGAAEKCASELKAICEDLGFMSITGHGIPQSLIDEVEAETKRDGHAG